MKVLFLLSAIGILFLLVTDNACATNLVKGNLLNGSPDAFDSIKGKIIDSITHKPIPFATISFMGIKSVRMTIMSNERGEFSTVLNEENPKVILSAIGYQERVCYLGRLYYNLVNLIPNDNILPGIIVSGRIRKKPKCRWLIKNILKKFEENYGNISYDQTFSVSSATRNYDSLKGKWIDLVCVHFDKSLRLIQIRKWKRDTTSFDYAFSKLIGVPKLVLGDILPCTDILRMGLLIDKNGSRNFDFRLQASYVDKDFGAVILVCFKLINKFDDPYYAGRTFVKFPFGYVRGEILVRMEDFAVVNIKYVCEGKTELLNKGIVDAYHSPYWKADRLGKIISNSVLYKYEYGYEKDINTGKYLIHSIKANGFDTGYQIENNRYLQLEYQFALNSMGLNVFKK